MCLLLGASLTTDTAGDTDQNLQACSFNGLTTVLAHTGESLRKPFLSMYQLLKFSLQMMTERQACGSLHQIVGLVGLIASRIGSLAQLNTELLGLRLHTLKLVIDPTVPSQTCCCHWLCPPGLFVDGLP
jgi:hypothetical protein